MAPSLSARQSVIFLCKICNIAALPSSSSLFFFNNLRTVNIYAPVRGKELVLNPPRTCLIINFKILTKNSSIKRLVMITFELIRIIINYNKFRFTPDARLFLARLEVLHTSRVLGFGILTKLHQNHYRY